jgi:hypothetical protein
MNDWVRLLDLLTAEEVVLHCSVFKRVQAHVQFLRFRLFESM